jgi:hypothetical protein
MDSDWKLNTKNIEDFFIFPTVIYLPSSDQQFRSYNPWKLTVLLETCFGQHGAAWENWPLTTIGNGNSEILEYKKYRQQPRLFDEFGPALSCQLEPRLWLSKYSSLGWSGWPKTKASRSRCGLTWSPERSTSKDKMSIMPSFWIPWQVAIPDPAKKTLNKTFGADGKSVLTTSSSQKSQR